MNTLFEQGAATVRAVDIKPFDEWYQWNPAADNRILDLQLRDVLLSGRQRHRWGLSTGRRHGRNGLHREQQGPLHAHRAHQHPHAGGRPRCGVERFFYSSSACVYNGDKQKEYEVIALKEEDAYPALPEDGYGWEKLFSERMCRHFHEDFGLETRIARFHNVYGPLGTWMGGREKAPAAICRKVLEAKHSGKHEIEIWGDGHQTRSFMYIDDCTKGVVDILNSDILEPINLGSSELVTINQLVDIAEDIAGVKLQRTYNLSAPKGVNGRNSDNTLIRRYLGWEPSIRLRDGMEKTMAWIEQQMIEQQMLAGVASK